MKSNFEIETDIKEKVQQKHHHQFVDSATLYPSAKSIDMDEVEYKRHDGDQLSGATYDEYDLESPYPRSISEVVYLAGSNKMTMMSGLPSCVLVVYLQRAKNIPHLDAWQIPNLYITFHYGDGGKGPFLSRSVITSNSDENDDPIWNEYAAIPLSSDLLLESDFCEQKLTLKFWDYSPIRPDDDVMIGKINIDLNDLYEEQIKEIRHLERKLQTPRNSVAAINFQYGMQKQLEDRDYIYVQKSLKMLIDDDLKQCVPNTKQNSLFEAMFKFCVLPNSAKIAAAHGGRITKNDQMTHEMQLQMDQMAAVAGGEAIAQEKPLRTSQIMKNMNLKLHKEQMSQIGDISEHMPTMSTFNPNLQLLQNYSGDDSYFLTQSENEEEIAFDDDHLDDAAYGDDDDGA
eukprot:473331_1